MSQANPLRLILDQGISRDAAELLREAECECIHVGEVSMAASPDRDIVMFAAAQGAIVVTLDADFHAILAVSGMSKPSVIRLRLQGLDANATAEAVRNVLTSFTDELQKGCLITVKPRKTTFHRLPVGSIGK